MRCEGMDITLFNLFGDGLGKRLCGSKSQSVPKYGKNSIIQDESDTNQSF
jgi:hypothetical protein